MTTNEKAELIKQLKTIDRRRRPLENRLNELKDREKKRENSKQIGNTYKFHNTCDGEKYWWLYMEVVGIDEYGDFIIDDYQLTLGTKPEIRRSARSNTFNYIKCSREEFEKGKQIVLSKLGLKSEGRPAL